MKTLRAYYDTCKLTSLEGRYLHLGHIASFLETLKAPCSVETLGHSVNQEAITCVTIGHGPKRILIWSQMHGNESTTTKALMDLFRAFGMELPVLEGILRECTLKIIPILNPDGARAYTRANANGVDLNRDAQHLSQPESMVLRNLYESFRPHYGFNMHGQRTIFSAGHRRSPATVSFLAPAFDMERSISETRAQSMQLIVAMSNALQEMIPDQIGRYDDAFNPNCVGDAFQMGGTVTVLFEAGHYPGDYKREKTREFIFYALCTALRAIADGTLTGNDMESYFKIPENEKLFYDVLIAYPNMLDPKLLKSQKVGILYKEVLRDGLVHLVPTKEHMEYNAQGFYGHLELDCRRKADLNWLINNKIPRLL